MSDLVSPTRIARWLFVALFACICKSASAQIPRVMILSDQVCKPAAAELAKALKGQATIVHVEIPETLPPTAASALSIFDTVVGKEKWDVIFFNFGIGELTCRAPGMKSFRILPQAAGGVRTTSADEYAKSLDALVQKLAQTRARLIWLNTLPITESNRGFLMPGSEIEYNQRAAAVMAKHRVAVIDLHAYVTEQIKSLKKGATDVFSITKTVPIHPPMLEAINPTLEKAKTSPKN